MIQPNLRCKRPFGIYDLRKIPRSFEVYLKLKLCSFVSSPCLFKKRPLNGYFILEEINTFDSFSIQWLVVTVSSVDLWRFIDFLREILLLNLIYNSYLLIEDRMHKHNLLCFLDSIVIASLEGLTLCCSEINQSKGSFAW